MLDANLATALLKHVQRWIRDNTGYILPANEIQGHSNLINNNQTQAFNIRFEIPVNHRIAQDLQVALKETKIALIESENLQSVLPGD